MQFMLMARNFDSYLDACEQEYLNLWKSHMEILHLIRMDENSKSIQAKKNTHCPFM